MRPTYDTDRRLPRGSSRDFDRPYSNAPNHSRSYRDGRGEHGEGERGGYSASHYIRESYGGPRYDSSRSLGKRERQDSLGSNFPVKRPIQHHQDYQKMHPSPTQMGKGAEEVVASDFPSPVRPEGDETPLSDSAELDVEDEESRIQRLLAESKARRLAILSKHQSTEPSVDSKPSSDAQTAIKPVASALLASEPKTSVPQTFKTQLTATAIKGAANDDDDMFSGEADIKIKKSKSKLDDSCMFADDSDDLFASNTPVVSVPEENLQSTAAQQVGGSLELRDSEGYLRVRAGDVIGGRYKVRGDMGRGVFANVLICMDMQARPGAESAIGASAAGLGVDAITAEDKQSIEEAASGTLRLSGPNAKGKKHESQADHSSFTSGGVGAVAKVAVKVLRANDTMRRAGIKEMEILKRIASADPTGRFHCVRLLDSFTHEDHLCLVFEAMSVNLKELQIKYGKGVGISLTAVRTYGTHILLALALLQNLGIVHADIKPHNVLVSENLSCAKLADFGSAFLVDDPEANPTPYLVSRFYRAPEIILGYNHTPALDIWSVATLLFELYTGTLLFPGDDNNDMLYRVQLLKGRFPPKMVRKHIQHCETTGLEPHFDPETLTFLRHTLDPVTNEPVVKEFQFAGPQESLMSRLKKAGGSAEQRRELENFCDLLLKMLNLDPSKRITVGAALKHPFFTQVPGKPANGA